MPPAEFKVGFEGVFETMLAIVVLSFFLERALALLFEWRPFVKKFEGKAIKTPIALSIAILICFHWKFDAVGAVFSSVEPSVGGAVLTAAVIAGGSKASIKLFRNVLDVKSNALREKENGWKPHTREPEDI
jgi:hypothetical protein